MLWFKNFSVVFKFIVDRLKVKVGEKEFKYLELKCVIYIWFGV